MASQRCFFTIFNSYFNFSTYIGQKNMIIVKCLIECKCQLKKYKIFVKKIKNINQMQKYCDILIASSSNYKQMVAK